MNGCDAIFRNSEIRISLGRRRSWSHRHSLSLRYVTSRHGRLSGEAMVERDGGCWWAAELAGQRVASARDRLQRPRNTQSDLISRKWSSAVTRCNMTAERLVFRRVTSSVALAPSSHVLRVRSVFNPCTGTRRVASCAQANQPRRIRAGEGTADILDPENLRKGHPSRQDIRPVQ